MCQSQFSVRRFTWRHAQITLPNRLHQSIQKPGRCGKDDRKDRRVWRVLPRFHANHYPLVANKFVLFSRLRRLNEVPEPAKKIKLEQQGSQNCATPSMSSNKCYRAVCHELELPVD